MGLNAFPSNNGYTMNTNKNGFKRISELMNYVAVAVAKVSV